MIFTKQKFNSIPFHTIVIKHAKDYQNQGSGFMAEVSDVNVYHTQGERVH